MTRTPPSTNNALVDVAWAQANLDARQVRFIEIDVDTTLYEQGHIPGAVAWDWTIELQDRIRRDIATRETVQELLADAGVDDETLVVLYGDNNNWFAAYGYWLLVVHGFPEDRLRLLDGGRKAWLAAGAPLSTDVAAYARTRPRLGAPKPEYRALRNDVLAIAEGQDTRPLVDVRSPDEFTGKVLAPPGLSETAQRGGHIPGAHNVPWAKAVNESDGTFRSRSELEALYREAGATPDQETLAYCRIGERSSHTWFVLNRILGWPARNYDGSWTEYGNLIGAPIETGPATRTVPAVA